MSDSSRSRNVRKLAGLMYSSKENVERMVRHAYEPDDPRENMIPTLVASLKENYDTPCELETIVAVTHGELCSIYERYNTGDYEEYCECIYALIECCLTAQSIIHSTEEENMLPPWVKEVNFVERVCDVLARAY